MISPRKTALYALPMVLAPPMATIGQFGITLTELLVVAAGFVLHDRIFARFWWLVPLRDLWSFAVWCAGAANRPVVWRGTRMKLDDEGRILPIK